jgi:DNA repair exonuclease SbcCD ATPase subunit
LTIEDLKIAKQNLAICRRNISDLAHFKQSRKELEEEAAGLHPNTHFNFGREMENMTDKFQEMETLIRSWEEADVYLKKKKDLDNLRQEVLAIERKLNATKRLKKVAENLRVDILQNTISSLNKNINYLATDIFTDPIDIRFDMTVGTKVSVKLNILYKGGEYDSVSDMSGGEGDRVSMILTLALNQLSSSPILLLDESMSSLNSDLQEKCLSMIKLNKKTVICIDHNSVEGYYDNIICMTTFGGEK